MFARDTAKFRRESASLDHFAAADEMAANLWKQSDARGQASRASPLFAFWAAHFHELRHGQFRSDSSRI